VTEPLQLRFRVGCPPDHAFHIWTARASQWWPADHSVSGEDADRSDATEVEIVFAPDSEEATEVRIDHRGWERLGGRGQAWRDRNRRGWETLLPWYVEFVEGGASDG
jgi:hypothetical protein